MRRSPFLVLAVLLLTPLVGLAASSPAGSQQANDWPRYQSDWFFEIIKDPDTEPPPFEAFDLQWIHLHTNHTALPDSYSNIIKPRIFSGYEEVNLASVDVEVRYVVRNVPVSGWLGAPFEFELAVDNGGLAQLADGVHGLTIEARGADRNTIQPIPAFVHITRDLANGEPFGFTKSVPILNSIQRDQGPTTDYQANLGPSIVYVDPSERNDVGYPVDPSAAPWSSPPHQADLYQEQLSPNSFLFSPVQMWWDHPAHSDSPFVRGLTPKHGEDHRWLRVDFGHEKFPMRDGPRGLGWMSPYISGQVDSQGRFAFAEVGGRVGYLMPDGEVITIAGWRVKPDSNPIWWEKPTAAVRQNMENRGNWTAGRGEFLTPLDVAVDPLDENVLYVAAYEDHVIWKIEVPADPRTQEATVSILAGDPGHAAGFVDGQGSAARLNGPGSLVFDPTADVLYVADQDNDAIRRIDRAGNVTTVAGSPGMQQRLTGAGVEWTDQLAARAATQFEVTPAEAASGVTPDIYLPQTIRVDSQGRIILLELGYGAIRRIDPTTLATETLGEVQQKHRTFDRGWAWLDVDRWGNSGPKDGIYWAKFVSTLDGENFNEVFEWLPPDGGDSVPLFPSPTGLYPDGWGRNSATNAPHYAWLVAVDPRGGVLLAGGGEHGVTRLRERRVDDPIETTEDYWLGRKVFYSGMPVDAPLASQTVAAKYGWNGHNFLGLTDAWALEGATDDELLDAFEVSNAVRNDVDARRQILAYLRPNTVGAADVTSPISQAMTVGLGAGGAGWIEEISGELPFEHISWPQVPWSAYNSANGETRPDRCDVDGNGRVDTVVGLGPGANGSIAINTDVSTWEWIQVPWSSYNTANGETFVACGDLDGDGFDEIVAGLGDGGAGWVYVFDDATSDYAPIDGGWLNIGWSAVDATHPAIGNLDTDAEEELILGTGPGGQRWSRIFDNTAAGFVAAMGSTGNGWIRASDTGSIANTDHNVWPSICDGLLVLGASSATGPGGGGWMNVLDTTGAASGPGWFNVPWSTYNNTEGAARPTCGDLDGDGTDEIAVGLSGTAAAGYVALFTDLADGPTLTGWPRVQWGSYNSATGSTWPAID